MRTMAAGAVSEVGVPAAVQAARTGVAQPLTAGLPGAQAGAEQPEPAAAQEGQDTCEASSPESAPHEAEGEPFEKRLMHLFHGADGVQAWIRDAELGAAQARGLALALANELAGGGNRLAALTVNGRKVELGADSVLDPDLPADSGRQDPDAAGITREFISKGQN
jgi:hypothetical protein